MFDIRIALCDSDENVDPATSPNTLTKAYCKLYQGLYYLDHYTKNQQI